MTLPAQAGGVIEGPVLLGVPAFSGFLGFDEILQLVF